MHFTIVTELSHYNATMRYDAVQEDHRMDAMDGMDGRMNSWVQQTMENTIERK
jgi:hypothetical protein